MRLITHIVVFVLSVLGLASVVHAEENMISGAFGISLGEKWNSEMGEVVNEQFHEGK